MALTTAFLCALGHPSGSEGAEDLALVDREAALAWMLLYANGFEPALADIDATWRSSRGSDVDRLKRSLGHHSASTIRSAGAEAAIADAAVRDMILVGRRPALPDVAYLHRINDRDFKVFRLPGSAETLSIAQVRRRFADGTALSIDRGPSLIDGRLLLLTIGTFGIGVAGALSIDASSSRMQSPVMRRRSGGAAVASLLIATAALWWWTQSAGRPLTKSTLSIHPSIVGGAGADATRPYEARLSNSGDRPVEITSVRASCVCYSVAVSARSIPPGGTAIVRVEWKEGKSARRGGLVTFELAGADIDELVLQVLPAP